MMPNVILDLRDPESICTWVAEYPERNIPMLEWIARQERWSEFWPSIAVAQRRLRGEAEPVTKSLPPIEQVEAAPAPAPQMGLFDPLK